MGNIITVSREFGSGGRELGKRLADELGYRYYDREILTFTAGELPVQARSDQVYELPCTATLSPGVSVLDLLVIASKKSLEGMTTDVKLDARLKNGMGLPLTFKKIDLQQFTQ